MVLEILLRFKTRISIDEHPFVPKRSLKSLSVWGSEGEVGRVNLREACMADVLSQKIIIPEALKIHALICYMNNIAICIPEKSYVESELCELDSFPGLNNVREINILSMLQIIKNL